MIETIFTLEDEPMTPETPATDAPEEGGMEEGAPAGLLEEDEETETPATEALLEEEEGEKAEEEKDAE